MHEFEDFTKNKTQQSAKELISAMIDSNLYKISAKENLVEYIGKRPRVSKEEFSNHGFFCVSNNGVIEQNVDIDYVMKEVGSHQGKIWTNVLSLRREDAIKTGFENREMWLDLLRSKVNEISEQIKIPVDELNIYGAFHNESHHPHCHFLVWSSDPKNEKLYRDGIKKLKSSFTHAIFGNQMLSVEKEKTLTRDKIKEKLKTEINKPAHNLEIKGAKIDSELKIKMVSLVKKPPEKGKKQFGFLSKNLKDEVIQIVDELAKTPEIELLYEKWKQHQSEIIGVYKENTKLDEFPKLSENESFRSVLNCVIREAWRIKSEVLPKLDETIIKKKTKL